MAESWPLTSQEPLTKRVTPHVVRHARAMHLLQSGVDSWRQENYFPTTSALRNQPYRFDVTLGDFGLICPLMSPGWENLRGSLKRP